MDYTDKKRLFRRRKRLAAVKLPKVIRSSNSIPSNLSVDVRAKKVQEQRSLKLAPLHRHKSNNGEENLQEVLIHDSTHNDNNVNIQKNGENSDGVKNDDVGNWVSTSLESPPYHTNTTLSTLPTIASGIDDLEIPENLKNLEYKFRNVSVNTIPTVVSSVKSARLPVKIYLDQRKHRRMEGVHVMINIIGRAFQAFDNALKLVLDNVHILQICPLVRILLTAAKLSLCHSKLISGQLGRSQQEHSKAVHFAFESLCRTTEVQDVLLIFSAEHMIAQTERMIATAPPRLAAVRKLQIALDVAQRHCKDELLALLVNELPRHVQTELQWTSTHDIVGASGLTHEQLRSIPNFKWSKQTQNFINERAKAGRMCLEKTQLTLKMVSLEKQALLKRLHRQKVFRLRAGDGLSNLKPADTDIIFFVAYDPKTGKDKAWTVHNFGTACLQDTERKLHMQLLPTVEQITLANPLKYSIIPIALKYCSLLRERLGVELDVLSEDLLVKAMKDLDQDLYVLVGIVTDTFKFIKVACSVQADLKGVEKLCEDAPAFRDEKSLQFVMKRGHVLLNAALKQASDPSKYTTVSDAVISLEQVTYNITQARALVNELPDRIADTKYTFGKRSRTLYKQARGQAAWVGRMFEDRIGKDVMRLFPVVVEELATCDDNNERLERLLVAVDKDNAVELGRVWAFANECRITATKLCNRVKKEMDEEIKCKKLRATARAEKMQQRAEARKAEVERFISNLPRLRKLLDDGAVIRKKTEEALVEMPILRNRLGMAQALEQYEAHRSDSLQLLKHFAAEETTTKAFNDMVSLVEATYEDALLCKTQVGLEIELMTREKQANFSEAKAKAEKLEGEAWQKTLLSKQKADASEKDAEAELAAAHNAVVKTKERFVRINRQFKDMQLNDVGLENDEYEAKLKYLMKLNVGDTALEKLPQLSQDLVKTKSEIKSVTEAHEACERKWSSRLGRMRQRHGRLETEAREATAVYLNIVFDELDLDGSGDLSMNELLPFLTQKQGLSKKAAIKTIRKVDIDGNGVVDRHEFAAMLVNWLAQLKYMAFEAAGFTLPNEEEVIRVQKDDQVKRRIKCETKTDATK